MHKQTAISAPTPIIVFGIDEKGKSHASRFKAADALLAEKAAALMSMQVLRVVTPDEKALAAKLPVGRVFASGRAFVPLVKRGHYDQLAAAPGAFAPPPPTDGPAKAAGEAKGGRKVAGGPDSAKSAEGSPEPPGVPAPDYASIGPGSVVLAALEGYPTSFYVCTVIADRGEDIFLLRWRDNDDGAGGQLAPFVRRREHLALFPLALADTLR